MENPYHPPAEDGMPADRRGPFGRRAWSMACCAGSIWIVFSGAYRFVSHDGLSLVPLFTMPQLFWFAIWVVVHAGSAFGLAVCARATWRRRLFPATFGFLLFLGACFVAWLFTLDFLGFNVAEAFLDGVITTFAQR